MTKVSQKKARVLRGLKPRERQKLDTRQRIKAAAWDLFTSDGYFETTTKAVAKKAKVAAGTVFLHADTKADLLFLVMHDRLAAVVDNQLATLPRGAHLVEQLMHVFRGLFRMYSLHPNLAAEFIRALPGAVGPNAAQVHALTFAFHHKLAELVREAQDRGEVASTVAPLLAASNLFVLYFGALHGWLNGFTSLETALEPGLRLALELQMRGLRA
jgi:TetR/AcrR family transcriptional regulator, cholesterol catabolism regulator